MYRGAGDRLSIIFQQLTHLLPQQGEGLPHGRWTSQEYDTSRRGRAEVTQDVTETTFETIADDSVAQRSANDEYGTRCLTATAHPQVGTANPPYLGSTLHGSAFHRLTTP